MPTLELPNGYYELPKGKLTTLVTCLEMVEKPAPITITWPKGVELRRFGPEDLQSFRTLFEKIGRDLMWFSRLIMPDKELKTILSNPEIESFALLQNGKAIGLLELNFESSPDCELAFFGLTNDVIGTGFGKLLMAEAKNRSWAKAITRFWVHTCHYDHPRAIGFYKASGFVPYALMIEVHDDPRLSGHLPLEASPHVALIHP